MQKSNLPGQRGVDEGALRIPPHSNEAEQAVLASLMIEADTLDRVGSIIAATDFYNKNNGIIYDTIVRLSESGKPYDLAMVSAALSAAAVLEQVGGDAYLVNLTFMIPNASNIERYAEQVKSKAKLRNLIHAATDIHDIAYEYSRDMTKDLSEALDKSGQLIFDLAEGNANNVRQMSDVLEAVYDDLERLYKSDLKMAGHSTGYVDIDKTINGLQGGSLIIIAGRPGMGKTAFALNIAENVAKDVKSVAVFSLEMSSEQLVQRIISSEAEIEGSKLQTGRFTDNDWQKIAAVGQDLSNLNIFIDDTSSISVMEIRAKCRRLKSNKEHGLDLVIIDYLQLMENKRVESREQQISEISRGLKDLARNLDVPVIALSQLNRSVESRTDKRPMMSDLRESGAIEQDADLIMFLYRDDYYNKDSVDKGMAEVIIAKNRHGATNTIKLSFQAEYTKFRNLEKHYLTTY